MEPARRLALGQWFTPPAVADLALALALPAGLDRARARVLDPACGDGVFLSRALAAGVPSAGLSGVEVDAATAALARSNAPGVAVAARDFFSLAPAAVLDAVVGNPPYVRQERLAEPAKQQIRRALAAAFPAAPSALLARVTGRGDLAAAFVAAALAAVCPRGRVALVVSSALLDAGYARALWQLCAPLGQVVALVDAPGERWFADAAVKPMILVLERGVSGRPVVVARLRVPAAEAAARVSSTADLARVADVRHAAPDRPATWAAHLRAPAAWFELADRAGPALRPLGEVAELRRGVTSGANDVFYLPRARAAALGLEPALLAPLVRSPRSGGERIAIDDGATAFVALVAPAERAALERYPAARGYLDAAAAAATRPTLAAREAWWSLPVRPARVFLTKAYHQRFVQRLAPRPVVADQRLYALHPRAGVDPVLLAATLNSTFTALALEALGRASLGEGALEWTVADAAALPVVDPGAFPPAVADQVRRALDVLGRQSIGTAREERERADRADLDRAIAAAVPGLCDRLPDVHDALITAVAGRTRRPAGAAVA